MKQEIPRDADGRRLCQHCLETPVPESLGTKPRSYCSRNCRQRAYEARKTGRAIRAAVAAATTARAATSRDDAERDDAAGTSRDVPAASSAVPGAERAARRRLGPGREPEFEQGQFPIG